MDDLLLRSSLLFLIVSTFILLVQYILFLFGFFCHFSFPANFLSLLLFSPDPFIQFLLAWPAQISSSPTPTVSSYPFLSSLFVQPSSSSLSCCLFHLRMPHMGRGCKSVWCLGNQTLFIGGSDPITLALCGPPQLPPGEKCSLCRMQPKSQCLRVCVCMFVCVCVCVYLPDCCFCLPDSTYVCTDTLSTF